MDELFITICVIGFTLTVLSPYFFNRYTKFKLEIEKMRLESELRKEEIRAKNQFDMEKYMADEQLKAGRMQAKQAYSDPQCEVNRAAQQTSAAVGAQPDFDDIRTRASGSSAAAEETDPASDSRGREKLRY